MRRAALSPYFSKQSVRALQPLIDRNMAILLGRFDDFAKSGDPLKLDDAFAALTNGKTMAPFQCLPLWALFFSSDVVPMQISWRTMLLGEVNPDCKHPISTPLSEMQCCRAARRATC